MQTNSRKGFFVLSFLPALAYWYLESNHPVRIAVVGGITLATAEIIFEKFYSKHVHSLSKFNFAVIALLGALSLLGEDGLWFKLQPFFTGIVIGPYLIWKGIRGQGMLVEMMESMGRPIPPRYLIDRFEWHTGAFMTGYGIFMGAIAIMASTDVWLFWKTGGFYICFTVFGAIETLIMRSQIIRSRVASLRDKSR